MVRSLLTLAIALSAASCEVPVRQCSSQTDCFGGEACVNGECIVSLVSTDGDTDVVADGALNDMPASDCRLDEARCGGQVCNVSTGLCEDCQRDLQCGDGGICDKVAGVCVCDPDFHACGGECARNDAVETCGTRCAICPGADNANPTCEAEQCGVACIAPFRACDGCGLDLECIECETSPECGEYGAARCDQGICTPCADNGDCAHLDRNVCVAGECVECDTGQTAACGGNSCDPATKACTTTSLRSRKWCESCLADSECEPNHRCVPMNYGGAPRPGGYCLEQANSPCLYLATVQVQRDSLSGIRGEFYCTIREDLVTCEAMNDFSRPCGQDNECGDATLADGKCRLFDGARQCTYACVQNEECSNGTSCIGNPPDNSYCARF